MTTQTIRLIIASMVVSWVLLVISGCELQAHFESHPTVMAPISTTPILPRPRFEELLTEGDNANGFAVFHDRETGQEIACRRDHARSLGCWLTGRSWQ